MPCIGKYQHIHLYLFCTIEYGMCMHALICRGIEIPCICTLFRYNAHNLFICLGNNYMVTAVCTKPVTLLRCDATTLRCGHILTDLRCYVYE
jgi:hypothetical protein